MKRPNQQLRISGAAILMVFLLLGTLLVVGAIGAAAQSGTGVSITQVRSLDDDETQTEHPQETETEHPQATETEHPEDTETEHPEDTETEQPRETETEHPRETETAEPRETETEQPEATETEHPNETETALPGANPSVPGEGSRIFPETGMAVSGIFLQYWDQNGGLMQQGFPISSVMQERSDLDGKVYTVQYFERAVFEYHPENQAPFNVLLSQLGTFRLKEKYPNGVPNQSANKSNGQFFPQTGHWVGGTFLKYWNEHGGLAQQGYPISDEFQEKSDLDGKVYTVQYFERAVFEQHPENQPPFNVLLSQLGTFRLREKTGK